MPNGTLCCPEAGNPPFRLPNRARLLRAGCSLAALLLRWRRAPGDCARRAGPCLATTGTVGPGGPAARSRPGEAPAGSYLHRGPGGRPTRSKPSGMRRPVRGPEIPWPKGAPLSPARRSTVTTWSSYWSGWGQEGWRWHVLASSSCRYPTGSGPMPAVWCCGVTTAGRPPSYIYLGKCLAGCCYLSFSAPVGINSTWLKPFVSEVGPVDRFSNLGKFRATWSQFRGVACL